MIATDKGPPAARPSPTHSLARTENDRVDAIPREADSGDVRKSRAVLSYNHNVGNPRMIFDNLLRVFGPRVSATNVEYVTRWSRAAREVFDKWKAFALM